MRTLSRSIAALVGAAALPALAGAEEITIVSKTTVKQGAPTTSTQYIGADRVRTSDGENDAIVEVGTGRLTVINHKKKEYYEFTRDEMLASMQKFEQQMSGPMGAMMEKMMGGKVPEVTLEKGASRKVAGYDCTSYTFSLGENMKYEMCVTQALQLPAAYYDALKGPYSMMGPMARRFDKLFEEMKKVKGFPVAMSSMVNLMGMKMQVASEATEVRKGAIAASAFALPAGYKKKETPFRQ
jgi:uncharacterized protein DUF4412